MHRDLAIVATLAFVALLSILEPSSPAVAREPEAARLWNAPSIAWHDIASGVRESSRSGRPVVMLFHASWCTSCKQYREVWKDAGVVEASKNFVMILVDVDKDPDANGAFSPDGTYVPRTLFLNSEGDVLTAYHGKDPEYPHTIDIKSPDELLSIMRRAAAEMPSQSAPQLPPSDRRAEN
ncbi:MAG: thioredoxin family protein [Hyphomicrobium sp.]|jgi:thioredoxin-like negative regulator of GroEL